MKLKDALLRLNNVQNKQLKEWLALRKKGYSYQKISKQTNPWVNEETIRLKIIAHQKQYINCKIR